MSEPFDPIAELSKRGNAVPTAYVPSFAVDPSSVIKEIDPNGKDPHQAGAKLDGGKIPLWRGVARYFSKALTAVGAISFFGSQKYTWGGWKTVEDGEDRYTDALLRHLLAEADGERYDPETKMLHAAQVAWNALARLELMLKEHPLRQEA